MIDKGTAISVKKFDMANAAVKADFSTDFLADLLAQELTKRVGKEGFNTSGSANYSIEGRFTLINQGSRFMRWFIGPFGAGATKCEVEGSIKEDGRELTSFCFLQKGYGGFGGGNSSMLLSLSITTLAKRIAKLLRKL
jgi:hypothetical protein